MFERVLTASTSINKHITSANDTTLAEVNGMPGVLYLSGPSGIIIVSVILVICLLMLV